MSERGRLEGIPTAKYLLPSGADDQAGGARPECRVLLPPEREAILPYSYGRIGRMKKTLHIDDDLLREARMASGATTDTEAVRLGLEALVRRAAYERLRALRGTDAHARDVPRRRERASGAKRSVA